MTSTDIRTISPEDAAEHLRGPWLAVLADIDGFVYPTVADAIDNLGEDEEVTIKVVRGTAMPNDRDGTTGVLLRLPGICDSGDEAYEIECYLVDSDPSVGAQARYAQAQAMAAGLNAAADRVHEADGPAACANCQVATDPARTCVRLGRADGGCPDCGACSDCVGLAAQCAERKPVEVDA